MRKSIIGILSALGGVAVGSTATFFIVKDKFKKIADEEIESVKERFTVPRKKCPEKLEPTIGENEDFSKYMNKPEEAKEDEGLPFDISNDEKKEMVSKVNGPHIISATEFKENPEYEALTLLYYPETNVDYPVVTTINGDLMDDPLDILGKSALDPDNFTDYDDAVYIQNDSKMTYYEVIIQEEHYYPEE